MKFIVSISKAKAKDIPAVKALELETNLSPWTETDLIAEVSRPETIFLVAKLEDQVVGYLIARLIISSPHSTIPALAVNRTNLRQNEVHLRANEAEILNFAVQKALQNTGIGTQIMRELLKILESYGNTKVFLEVRESNFAAIEFYEKCKFQANGKRKNFYLNPTEDAVLMTLEVSNS